MGPHKGLSGEVLSVLEELEGLLEEFRPLGAPGGWEELLVSARNSLAGDTLKIAVAGTVKAGKSTLANALLQRDFLKRGAGVITAFITRIVAGDEPRATVRFKSLEEVNRELARSLVALPGGDVLSAAADIEDPSFRREAGEFLGGLDRDILSKEGRFDPSFIHALNLIEGYDHVAQFLKDPVLELSGERVGEHRDLVGDEPSAVFLEDVLLTLPARWLAEGLELSDCQGADSPNPHHLARLQAHLLDCNLLIYVVGSRVGLREADLTLVETLKGLGLTGSAFFVLNLDLDDHQDPDEVADTVARFEGELARLIETERVYSFSALEELARHLREEGLLSERDSIRVAGWETAGLDGLSREGFASFLSDLQGELGARRNRIILEHALKRMELVVQSMGAWSSSAVNLAEKEFGEIKSIEDALNRLKGAQAKALGGLMRGVDGVKEGLKGEIAREVDRLFAPHGPLMEETGAFIDSYQANDKVSSEDDEARERPLPIRMYQVFRDFREAMHRALVERVNVRVAGFCREQSQAALKGLSESVRSLWTVFLEGLKSYREPLAALGLNTAAPQDHDEPGEVAPAPLRMPLLSDAVNLEGVDVGRVALRIGSKGFRRLLLTIWGRITGKKPSLDAPRDEGLRLAKAEVKKELRRAFLDFRENIKFAYLYRLLEDAGRSYSRELEVRAGLVISQVESLIRSLEGSGTGTRELVEGLNRLKGECDRLGRRVGEMSGRIRTDLENDKLLEVAR